MPACLVCGDERLDTLHRDVADHLGVAPGHWSFLRCRACGSATVDPMPEPEDLAAYYPSNYCFAPSAPPSPAARLLARIEARLFYGPMLEARWRIVRRLADLGAGRILEVGCGNGRFLELLRAHGYDVEGIELSEADGAYARQCLGLPVVAGTLGSCRLAAGRYDAVLLLSVLEHLPEPLEDLREVVRILRPGGSLVLAVPLVDSLQARVLGRRWYAVGEAPRHVTLPSERGVRHLMEAAGFVSIRTAAAPLLENAGIVALSMSPRAATALTHRRSAALGPVAARLAGAALVPAGLVLAAIERLASVGRTAGVTLFRGVKPGG